MKTRALRRWQFSARLGIGERIRFQTVHTSKGLEADHVILLGLTAATSGFPTGVVDDPVLQLALPEPEQFPYAEERRLFYVALTRARQTVTLVTPLDRESAFILEVVRDYKVASSDAQGQTAAVDACPACGKGTLVARKGPYGQGRWLHSGYIKASTAALGEPAL